MKSLSLYQLSDQYIEALEVLTDPEADLPVEVINDTLEAVGGELEDKAVNVAKFLRNMEATAGAIKEAEAHMAKRRKALENRVKWMKDYLKANMQACDIHKIECPYFKIAIQNNPGAVHIQNEATLPAEFKQQVISWKINKTAIKEAIKNGDAVPGAELVNGTRLVIR